MAGIAKSDLLMAEVRAHLELVDAMGAQCISTHLLERAERRIIELQEELQGIVDNDGRM